MNDWKLEIWPGYLTSLQPHESKTLMCVDISSKILRTDTVLDQLSSIRKNVKLGEFPDRAKRALMGSIVMTRYNNKTYRIDDIDFKA